MIHSTISVLSRIKFFALGIILILSFSQCKMYTAYHNIVSLQKENLCSEEKRTPRLEYVNSFPILHLYGTPSEMGQQYGTILKKQLSSMVELANELFPKKKIEKYIQDGEIAEKNLPEKFKIELKAMSEASGVDYSTLLALNMAPKATCSTLAAWGKATANGNLLMGRNADYDFKKVNKALGLIVVKHPSEGYATVTITFLGLIGGFSGINETGLCYGNMLVYNGKNKITNLDGLPIQILMQWGGENDSSANEMVDFLSNQSHMVDNNVMCADRTQALLIELSHRQSKVREGEEDLLVATNFFLSPELYNQYEPCKRQTTILEYSKKNYGTLTLTGMQKAMYLGRKKGSNLQCVIFEPETYKISVSMNRVPASKGPFTELDIKKMVKD